MDLEKRKRKSSIGISLTKIDTIQTSNLLRSLSRLKVRRKSYGFSGVSGTCIGQASKSAQVLGNEFKRPTLMYLPTYQLNPRIWFHVPSVQQATEESLTQLFTGHKYHINESPALAIRIAGDVMRKVKAMQFDRYRIITVVTLGQKRAQSYNNAVSFIWDHERDNYCDVQMEVTSAFIQVTTFGIYLD